jgi:hypothetical protein
MEMLIVMAPKGYDPEEFIFRSKKEGIINPGDFLKQVQVGDWCGKNGLSCRWETTL